MTDTLAITDNRTGKTYEIPIQDGAIRAMDLRQIKTGAGGLRADHLRSRVPEHRRLPQQDHLHRRRQGRAALPRLPDRAAGRAERLPRDRLPHSVRRAADDDRASRRGSREVTLHTMLHENIKKFMEGFQYDAHPMGIFLSTVGALSTFYPDAKEIFSSRVAPGADGPAHREGAEHRRLRLPAQHRTALRPSGQRSELLRQLPEHAVQDDGDQVSAEPGARARARRALHPARRSRAELLDARDARHRQLARRSVLGARRRGGRALRPAARRRERGGAAHAAGDRLDPATSRRSSSA